MEITFHHLKALFEQLGLPADCDAITKYIATHAPLHPGVFLAEENFWETSQKGFLEHEQLKDVNWSEVIELLNA